MRTGNKIALFYSVITVGVVIAVTLLFYGISAYSISRLYRSYLVERAYALAERHWEKDEADKEAYAGIQIRYEQAMPVAKELSYDADLPATRQALASCLSNDQIERLYQGELITFHHDKSIGVALYYPDNEGNFIVLLQSQNQYGTAVQYRMGWLLFGLVAVCAAWVYWVGRLYANRMVDQIDAAYHSEKSFISNASHELNNPLTAIQGECEISLLKERSAEEYQAALRRIDTETKRIIQLIKHLLFLSRGEQEILSSAKETFGLAYFLSQFASERVSFAADNGKLMITANPYLLKIAIKNLVGNACKYSGDKPVEMRLQGSVLSIVDQGIGIPDREMKHIFQPFFRASNTRDFVGQGVGLSLSMRILKVYGAKVRVSSELGVGTRIEVDFPVGENFC